MDLAGNGGGFGGRREAARLRFRVGGGRREAARGGLLFMGRAGLGFVGPAWNPVTKVTHVE